MGPKTTFFRFLNPTSSGFFFLVFSFTFPFQPSNCYFFNWRVKGKESERKTNEDKVLLKDPGSTIPFLSYFLCIGSRILVLSSSLSFASSPSSLYFLRSEDLEIETGRKESKGEERRL